MPRVTQRHPLADEPTSGYQPYLLLLLSHVNLRDVDLHRLLELFPLLTVQGNVNIQVKNGQLLVFLQRTWQVRSLPSTRGSQVELPELPEGTRVTSSHHHSSPQLEAPMRGALCTRDTTRPHLIFHDDTARNDSLDVHLLDLLAPCFVVLFLIVKEPLG
jgi:hypothetical protein